MPEIHENEPTFEDTHTKALRYTDPNREPPADPHRRGGMRLLADLLGSTAIYEGQQTHAPSPCWSDSTTKAVKWVPQVRPTLPP